MQVALQQAEVAVAQAQAKLRQLRELQLPVVEQSLRQARATLDNARAQFQREQDWFKQRFIGQQRVAVARARALNLPLLLANEPTGNLDSKSADAAFELLRKVNREQGTAILFVTHNLALAQRRGRTIQVVDGLVAA